MAIPDREIKRIFTFDVASAAAYQAVGTALQSLFAFIAVNRLGASTPWAGFIIASVYAGFVFSAMLGPVTGRIDVRSGILWIMTASAILIAVAAFQRHVVTYSAAVMAVLVLFGLYHTLYVSFIRSVYLPEERPALLSRRQLVVSITAAAIAPAAGWLCDGPSEQTPAFLLAATSFLIGAALFAKIKPSTSTKMDSFDLKNVLRTIVADQRFRRLAIILTLYGWIGAGTGTTLVALYKRFGMSELDVGVLSAFTTVGIIAATAFVTPRLAFAGGASNYRLCFSSGGAAMGMYAAVFAFIPDKSVFWFLAAANVVFGVSVAGFTLAMQTTALNLAPPGRTARYVSSLMLVQGARGIVLPIIVAFAIARFGLAVALATAVGIGGVCVCAVWLPDPGKND